MKKECGYVRWWHLGGKGKEPGVEKNQGEERRHRRWSKREEVLPWKKIRE